MSEILAWYKAKVELAVNKFSTFVKGPVGDIQDKSVRLTLLTLEQNHMEEALEKAFNEARAEFRKDELE